VLVPCALLEERGDELQIIPAGQVLVGPRILREVADDLTDLVGLAGEVMTENVDRTRGDL
jgi:hypothetical protein